MLSGHHSQAEVRLVHPPKWVGSVELEWLRTDPTFAPLLFGLKAAPSPSPSPNAITSPNPGPHPHPHPSTHPAPDPTLTLPQTPSAPALALALALALTLTLTLTLTRTLTLTLTLTLFLLGLKAALLLLTGATAFVYHARMPAAPCFEQRCVGLLCATLPLIDDPCAAAIALVPGPC